MALNRTFSVLMESGALCCASSDGPAADFIACLTVTLSKATGSAPISVSDFDTIDDLGNVYQPYLVPGQPIPPSVLRQGQRVTFELRVGEPVGEGLMRWAPIGGRIVAKWDFVVEND
jgi:hypothetical protein